MLHSERMSEVSILAKKKDTKRVIGLLMQAKAMHLIQQERQTVNDTEIDIGTPLESADQLSGVLTKARTLLHKLPKNKKNTRGKQQISARIRTVEKLAEEYGKHEQKIAASRKHIQELKQKKILLGELDSVCSDPVNTLFEAKSITTFLVSGDTPNVNNPILLNSENQTHLICVQKNDAPETLELLKAANNTIMDLTQLEDLTGTPKKAQQQVQTLLEKEQQLEQREIKAAEQLKKHVPFLRETEHILTIELLKAQAPLHFGTTNKIMIIEGFIPDDKIDTFEENLKSSRLHVLYEKRPAEEAPIELKNPPVVDNFEALINLYTLPKYHEIDPTTIMAFAFPFFFGFMLGDIGYGIALLGLFLMLRHYIPSTRQFANIIILSAISTIIFGIIFGEIFGLEEIFGFHLPHLIHRTGEVNTMLLIAIGIGVIHINIGLVLGIINKAREHGWIHGIVEKGSWILLQVGLVLVAGAHGMIPFDINGYMPHQFFAWAVLAIAIGGIVYSEKLQGFFELPMIVSHALSYTRLVAIGMASVYLAIVVNELGGGLVGKGGLWILAGVLVIIVGHVVNLALGLLGPFLHSLRLHYAEFFMKFYTGGGEKYRPFGVIESE